MQVISKSRLKLKEGWSSQGECQQCIFLLLICAYTQIASSILVQPSKTDKRVLYVSFISIIALLRSGYVHWAKIRLEVPRVVVRNLNFRGRYSRDSYPKIEISLLEIPEAEAENSILDLSIFKVLPPSHVDPSPLGPPMPPNLQSPEPRW